MCRLTGFCLSSVDQLNYILTFLWTNEGSDASLLITANASESSIKHVTVCRRNFVKSLPAPQFPGPVKFPMNTTRIAQYAALAANISCLAALVNTLMAALNSSVNTISTPTALNVFRVVSAGELESVEMVLVRWYIVIIGMTSRMKMTKVMNMLTILSMRDEL
jgi:hypothetical protein